MISSSVLTDVEIGEIGLYMMLKFSFGMDMILATYVHVWYVQGPMCVLFFLTMTYYYPHFLKKDPEEILIWFNFNAAG